MLEIRLVAIVADKVLVVVEFAQDLKLALDLFDEAVVAEYQAFQGDGYVVLVVPFKDSLVLVLGSGVVGHIVAQLAIRRHPRPSYNDTSCTTVKNVIELYSIFYSKIRQLLYSCL